MGRLVLLTLVLLSVIGTTPPAVAATTNTAEIDADTMGALPRCLNWRLDGTCLWLRCSLRGCRVRTTIRVHNYTPDAVVTVRNNIVSNPWVEMSPVTAASNSVLLGLTGGLADANGNMGSTNEANRDRQHLLFRDADVFGHPLSAASFLGAAAVAGPICLPRTVPLFPYFQSGLDALVWRDITPVESLYPAALIPGMREIGNFPLNTWGSVYPRTGAIQHPEEPKAAAVIAQRAGDIVTRIGQPHVYVPLSSGMLSHGNRWWNPDPLHEDDEDTGVWQMLEPRLDTGCYAFGANDSVLPIGWSDGRKDDAGDYVFNLWRPYSCCRRAGIYIGHVPGQLGTVVSLAGLANLGFGLPGSLSGLAGIIGNVSTAVTIGTTVYSYLNWDFPSMATSASTHALRAVPTFHSVGLYWDAPGSASQEVQVRYRRAGTTAWRRALNLWYDDRSIPGAPPEFSRQYRGSIVSLNPGTEYEIEVLNTSTGELASTAVGTWSEDFPVARTVTLSDTSQPLVITHSGTPNGYVVYEGPATIDVRNQADYAVDIQASYVIVRNLTIAGARRHAINVRDNQHHVVIDSNDISDWGRLASDGRYSCNRDSGVYATGSNIHQLIIQRNEIHHPRGDANRAFDGVTRAQEPGCFGAQTVTQPNGRVYQHTQGAHGISLFETGGNHVIRYNEIYSDEQHKFAYGLSGGVNRSYTGSPGRDSDVYSNIVTNVAGNSLELEGGGANVRAFNNFLDGQGEDQVGLSSVSIGPLYFFRNITYRNQPTSAPSSVCQGTALKNQSTTPSGTLWGGGRLYVLHNTLYKTSEGDCAGHGLSGITSQLLNVVSRNNIYDVSGRSIDERDPVSGAYVRRSDLDYDLMSSALDSRLAQTGQETHGILGIPAYGGASGPFSLTTNSPGYDAGEVLPNFSDAYVDQGPDMGAVEAGMDMNDAGTQASLIVPPEPPASAGGDISGEPIIVSSPVDTTGTCSGKSVNNWPTSRNLLEWPFASTSIWNTPIGCNVRYINARLDVPDLVDIDEDIFIVTHDADPIVPVYKAGGNLGGGVNVGVYGTSTNRCNGTVDIGNYNRVVTNSSDAFRIHFPQNYVLPSIGQNYSTAMLMPDQDNIRQLNALARCVAGGPVYGLNPSFANCQESIRGDGNSCYGGHGGTGLSSIGGTLRAMDFTNDEPIRHALKVNLRPWQYYNSRTTGQCEHRWPAFRCDNDINRYGGMDRPSSHVYANRQGALLAILPTATPESLGITTPAGRKMFDVLQDYGVYTVDGSGTATNNVRNSFSATGDAEDAFERHYGHPFSTYSGGGSAAAAAWRRDIQVLMSNLHVVDDNSPSCIGGCGDARRRPMAP